MRAIADELSASYHKLAMMRKSDTKTSNSSFGMLAKLHLSLLAILCSSLICFLIAERFFFDELFYKKSALFGYNTPLNQHDVVQPTWVNELLTFQREYEVKSLLLHTPLPVVNPDESIVVVIGDSFAYGTGVLSFERYSNVLAKELKKNGIKAKVFNFSLPGNSILDDYIIYKEVKDVMDPTVIVFGIVANDLLFEPNPYLKTGDVEQAFQTHCPQPRFAPLLPPDIASDEYIKYIEMSFSPAWENRCYLEKIAEILSKDPSVIYFRSDDSPFLANCPANEPNNGYVTTTAVMQEYEAVFKKYGIPGVTHERIVLPNYETVSALESHPSKAAHSRYAKELSRFMTSHFTNLRITQ